MSRFIIWLSVTVVAVTAVECPNYERYARDRHEPFSSGRFTFPFQRPSEQCRTYRVPAVEHVVYEEMPEAIGDPDLYRLFQNTWPNTVDTTVRWTGVAADNPDEEVCWISLLKI